MKKSATLLGFIGLGLLATACSGGEEPAPFPTATDLAARLAQDLECPAYVEADVTTTFIAVQGKSRVIAAPDERGVGDGVRAWLSRYAHDIGVDETALRVAGEARDAGSAFHVSLSTGAPANVETFGYGVELTLDPEGRLLGVIAHAAPNVDYSPKVSASAAVTTAERAFSAAPLDGSEEAASGPAPAPTTQLLLTTPPGEAQPRLAHRVDVGARSAWIDAATGEVLTTSDGVTTLQAEVRGWKAYSTIPFPENEKRRRVDYENVAAGVSLSRPAEAATFWSKPKSKIVLASFSSFDQNGMFLGAPVVAPTTTQFDTGYRSRAANQAPTMADGLAVDAMAEVNRAESYFQNHLFASPSRRLKTVGGIPVAVDEPIQVLVHANHESQADFRDSKSAGKFRNNAAHYPGTTTLIIGDGDADLLDEKGNQGATVNRSPALSTDAMAHEMTHMWLDSRLPHGEARSMEEGLGDVVGQFVEHEVAEAAGTPSRPDRVAEGVVFTVPVSKEGALVDNNGARRLARPDQVGADSSDSFRRDCLIKRDGKPVVDARGQPILDPKQHAAKRDANWCDHINATVVGHAFYLMTLGGRNVPNNKVIRNPIGWAVSERLWLSMLVKVPTAQGLRSVAPQNLLDFARQQLSHAALYPRDVANAVGCAWEAVKVLPAGTTEKLTGLACSNIAPIKCTGRPDGVYCDENNDASATRCERGNIGLSPAACPTKPIATECRPRGGFITNQAETTADGKLVCYKLED